MKLWRRPPCEGKEIYREGHSLYSVFMKSRRFYRHGSLKFLIVAIVLMVIMEKFFFGGPPVLPPMPAPAVSPSSVPPAAEVVPEPQGPRERFGPPRNPLSGAAVFKGLADTEEEKIGSLLPAWKKYAVPVTVPPDLPKIIIIIDDLGPSRAHTAEVVALPGPLTLSFLPYPEHVRDMVEKGRAAGHEIMMHMPMEPVDAALDKGAYVLRPEMTPAQLAQTLESNMKAFDGYVGINNHMGSRLTQDRTAMGVVMEALRREGLLFVDSRTISTSVAEDEAARHGLPHAGRDVFLDNDPDPAAVFRRLALTEQVARRKGYAIAIGHPKTGTIEALHAWLPSLKDKGFTLVPVSAVAVVSAPASTATTEPSAPVSASPAPPQQPSPPPG